jgi:hypothetical protein
MRTIYINGKFLSQPITGVQRFAYEIVGELDKLIDKFVETFLGKNKLIAEPFTISVSNDINIVSILKRFKQFLMTNLELALNSGMKNTDLKNIRDEMLGVVNQSLFLLKLK